MHEGEKKIRKGEEKIKYLVEGLRSMNKSESMTTRKEKIKLRTINFIHLYISDDIIQLPCFVDCLEFIYNSGKKP